VEAKNEADAIAARVNRWGLRVLCCKCGREWRHRPKHDGRLRQRASVCCSAPMMGKRWAQENRDKARARVLDARRTLSIFD
jgi:hypothetical protein